MNGRAPLVRGVAAILLTQACQGAAPPGPPAVTPVPPPPPPSASVPADTMVTETPNGYQVWLAEGREARDSAGAECFERSVEIRRGALVTKVPLLFTTKRPTVLNRNSIRAELTRDCRVVGVYRVDLATGRPTRLPR